MTSPDVRMWGCPTLLVDLDLTEGREPDLVLEPFGLVSLLNKNPYMHVVISAGQGIIAALSAYQYCSKS